MLKELVEKMEVDRVKKTAYVAMARDFEDNLPESLYMDHYRLSEEFGKDSKLWNEFIKLKDVDRFIESQIGIIGEIAARKSLQVLQSGKATSQDIQAAKELLSTSKLLKQKNNQFTQVVISRVPGKDYESLRNTESDNWIKERDGETGLQRS